MLFFATYPSSDPNYTHRLKTNSSFDSAVFTEFSDNELQIGTFFHPHLPLKARNCFFKDQQGDLTVFISGNVYNLKELALQSGISDLCPLPGFVAELFKLKGPDFVSELNGDFVIFIHSALKDELLVFRDHLGMMPLSYIRKNDRFYFSSDHINLCKSFQTEKNTDFEVLLNGFKYLSAEKSLNTEVNKLLPGHYLHFKQGKTDVVKYWFPEKIKIRRNKSQEEFLEEIRKLLEDAVSIRCDRDYCAAAHISGGLDSGYVGVLARKICSDQEHFYGLSWSPEHYEAKDLEFDERDYVREICEMNSLVPVFYNNNEISAVLEKPVYYPSVGSFDEEITLNFAAQNGVNIIFSGWGGDDFVSVSNSGIVQDLFFQGKWKTIFKNLGWKRKLKLLLYDILLPYFRIVPKSVKTELNKTSRYLQNDFQQNDSGRVLGICTYRSRRDIHLNFLNDGHISERAEITSNMACRLGIEYRFPLLDKRIIELMLATPSGLLYSSGYTRSVIRKLGEGILPDAVRFRKTKYDAVVENSLNDFFEDFDVNMMADLSEYETAEMRKFFNFEVLKQDWKKYKDNQAEKNDNPILLCAIYEVKMIHDFITSYKYEEHGTIHSK